MTEKAHGVDPDDVQTLHDSEGHSVAAWTAVAIIMAGTIIMALAVVFPSVLWFVVGVVVVVLGIVAGKVLAMAGYGQKSGKYTTAESDRGNPGELPGRNQTNSGTQ